MTHSAHFESIGIAQVTRWQVLPASILPSRYRFLIFADHFGVVTFPSDNVTEIFARHRPHDSW